MFSGDLVSQLFSDFCYYRRQTAYHQQLQRTAHPRDPRLDSSRRQILEEMVQWCEQHALPPRQWLYYLFARRRWLYSPQIIRSNLMAEKAVAGFSRCTDFEFFSRRMRELENLEISQNPSCTYDPNRDLDRGTELLKDSFLRRGQAQICQDRMHAETFGYHPRSGVCFQCPQQQSCREQLMRSVPFDILALRRGEISGEQARAAVLAGVNRYGY